MDKSDFDFNDENNQDQDKNTGIEDLINFEDLPTLNNEIKYRVNYPLDSSGLPGNDYLKSLECKNSFN